MIKEIISKIVITEIIRMFAIIKKTVTDAITEKTAAEEIVPIIITAVTKTGQEMTV